jgi:hypothetical protein
VYQDTTEHRHQMRVAWPYSSCGDLGHALAEDMGVRARWLNRASVGQYDVGRNISDLWDPALGGPARRIRPGERFHPGDIVIAGFAAPADTHVLVVLVDTGDEIVSADYGQARMRRTESWETGCRVVRRVRRGDVLVFASGQRPIDRVISLDELPGLEPDSGVLAEARAWIAADGAQPPRERDTDPAPPPVAPEPSEDDLPLRYGDRGPLVIDLQRRLVAAGAALRVDGSYGPATLAAVRAYQARAGLTADGVVGRLTWRALADA